MLAAYARRVFEDVADYLNRHSKFGSRSKDMQYLRGSVTAAHGGLQVGATVMVDDGSGENRAPKYYSGSK